MHLVKSSGLPIEVFLGRIVRLAQQLARWGALVGCLTVGSAAWATDYFVTIGGGYTPAQNQASLEANVQFFQQLLRERHRGGRAHDIFFADGDDASADLQVAVDDRAEKLVATKLLETLHRQDGEEVEYRNHRVADIAGANEPERVRASLERIGQRARPGDRLIVYVTAHGGRAEDDDPYNTTITCWNDQSITMRQLTQWLDKLPDRLPVVLVMAQCYCGGFSHAIFTDGDDEGPLARPLRIGFFAQQHNLAAAGCRPDIENDEEFSSYFWGAMAGRSRTGKPIDGCDLDHNGQVSFLEAYAYSVTASTTIDIPLRATDVLLSTYSRIGEQPAEEDDSNNVDRPDADEPAGDDEPGDQPEDREAEDRETGDRESDGAAGDAEQSVEAPNLARFEGRLDALVADQAPAVKVMVERLSQDLGVDLSTDASELRSAYRDQRNQTRQLRRGSRRRGRSGRREVLAEIAERWPELADRDRWRDSPLLEPARQAELVAEIKQLPSYAAFDERARRRQDADRQSEESERREVKYRRLLQTLESIILAKNLPQLAQPNVVRRYEEMLRLENSAL